MQEPERAHNTIPTHPPDGNREKILREGWFSEQSLTLISGLDQISDYQIVGEIGRGAMGIVHRGRHASTGEEVAIKCMLDNPLTNRDSIERFVREAKIVQEVDHPNVVRVLEVLEHEGLPCIVMELVSGGTLESKVQQSGPLPLAEAAAIITGLAQAMDHVHSRGIIHRDLKPGNVLMTPLGQPKIADFGLGKHVEGTTQLTRDGAILGTPAYMSPEQATGDRADRSSDIYALGAILFHLLTGRPPFEGGTIMDLLQRVAAEPAPSIGTIRNQEVPQALEDVCWKCLRKDREERYVLASAFASDLERALGGERAEASEQRQALRGSSSEVVTLAFVRGPDAGNKPVITAGRRWQVGRGTDCDVQLRDRSVGRAHCIIDLDREGMTILNLHRTGTFVNDHAVEGEQPLFIDDTIRLGGTLIHVQINNAGDDETIMQTGGYHPSAGSSTD